MMHCWKSGIYSNEIEVKTTGCRVTRLHNQIFGNGGQQGTKIIENKQKLKPKSVKA